jgi:hypothetical protein
MMSRGAPSFTPERPSRPVTDAAFVAPGLHKLDPQIGIPGKTFFLAVADHTTYLYKHPTTVFQPAVQVNSHSFIRDPWMKMTGEVVVGQVSFRHVR